jgi:hypothetical protein
MSDLVHVPLDPAVANARAAGASALDMLNGALLYIDDMRARCVALDDTEGLMVGLSNLVRFSAQLKTVVQAVEGDLADLLPKGWHPVPGDGGYINHGTTTSTTWSAEDALRDVTRRAFVRYLEANDGEITNVADVIASVVNAIYAAAPLAPSNQWRVTALRDQGLEPDEYRQTTERDSVKWHADLPVTMSARQRARLISQKERVP